MAKEIARLVAPLVPSLPHDGDSVHALEPSAGIGRFLRAFEPVPGITWHAVEWSELSARMLHVLRPDVDATRLSQRCSRARRARNYLSESAGHSPCCRPAYVIHPRYGQADPPPVRPR